MREMTPYQRLIYYLVVPVAVGLVMAKIGPYGTYDDLNFNQRAAYWISIFVLNWLQVDLISRFMIRVMPTPTWPFPSPWIAGAVLAAIPATLEVYILEAFLREHKLDHLVGLYFNVAMVTLVVSIPLGVFNRDWQLVGLPAEHDAAMAEPGSISPTAAPCAMPPFMRRVPAHLGCDLLCLEMEDHYLRIHTALGSDIILCRMRDAADELQGVDGAQVHRSYWVARAAVRAVTRDGDRPVLILSNNLRVPVSRSNRRRLRAAGWL